MVGIARACDGALIRQFRYEPYGALTGIDALQSDGTTLAALDADIPIDAWLGGRDLPVTMLLLQDSLGRH